MTSTQALPQRKPRIAQWVRLLALWAAAFVLAWLLAVSGIAIMPLGSLLILVVELAVAVTALVATLRWLWPKGIPTFGRQFLSAAGTCLALGAFVIPLNWATLAPAGNYFAHMPSYGILSHQIDRGDYIGSAEEYQTLSPPLASLSANGAITTAGTCDEDPVYFIPQWFGIPDAAGGYLYIPDTGSTPPLDCTLSLHGRFVSLQSAHQLPDGWWWI